MGAVPPLLSRFLLFMLDGSSAQGGSYLAPAYIGRSVSDFALYPPVPLGLGSVREPPDEEISLDISTMVAFITQKRNSRPHTRDEA